MRYLLISIILLQLSCSLPTTKNLVTKEVSISIIQNPYFSNPEKDYIYKAKIDVLGNKFGGILIIKKTNDLTHRIVFTNEFGNTLFDFLFENNEVKVINVIDDLNKKIIIRTLQNDFELLISEKHRVIGQFETNNENVFKTWDKKRFSFYFYNKNTFTLKKILNTSKSKEKVEVLFSNIESDIANSILINHKNINLSIALEKFKKETHVN